MSTLVAPATVGRVLAPRPLITRHPLGAFFVLVLVLAWPLMIVDGLGRMGLLPFRVPLVGLIVLGYTPTIAALIVTGAMSGRAGIRALLKRLLVWRVDVRWYIVAIFGYGLLCAATVRLHALVAATPGIPVIATDFARFSEWQLIGVVTLLFLLRMLLNGEELAWRGYALPLLHARRSPLGASLVLGLATFVFHLPLFWIAGSSQAGRSLASLLIGAIALSIVFTWIFNNTHGSVLLVSLMHAAANTWTAVFPMDRASLSVTWMLTGLTCLVALLLVVLTRGRLGYRSERAAVTAGIAAVPEDVADGSLTDVRPPRIGSGRVGVE